MGKLQRFVVIDLETTGHASRTEDKIIEIGIVVIESLEIVKTYSTFINPKREIPSFIQSLTNISSEDVQDAPCFQEVAQEVKELFHNSYLIAHNVDFDMGFLNDELATVGIEGLKCPTIDTVELARILLPQAPSYKLSEITDYIDIKHDQPHRALSDAYVTAELFIYLVEKLKELPEETIKQLIALEPFLHSDLNNLLHKIYFEKQSDAHDISLHHNLAFKSLKVINPTKPIIKEKYPDFQDQLYRENGLLAQNYPKYEHRTGQKQISEQIKRAFDNGSHAMIEAGTGIGKTLAYLIPAIYKACLENTRVVVSTYTTQLQSQILFQEIPLIKKAIPFQFDVALLKGKKNYLSLERFSYELANTSHENYDVVLAKAMILVWITESNTGDLDEIQLPSGAYHFYLRICEAHRQFDKSDTTWQEFSYYNQAKTLANQAHIIITNHALLCTDMKSEVDLIPTYSCLVIDEAHQLERVATKQFGEQISYIAIQNILNRLGTTREKNNIKDLSNSTIQFTKKNIFEKWNENYQDFKYELDELFTLLFNYTISKNERESYGDTGRLIHYISALNKDDSTWRIIYDIASRIRLYLERLKKILIESNQILEQNQLVNEANLANVFLQQLVFIDKSLGKIFNQDQPKNQVRWIEVDSYGQRNSVHLYIRPKSIKTDFQELLFNKKKSVILTSASLTINNSFSFIQEALGINTNVVEDIIPSPFNYFNQVKLLVPNDFPSVQNDSQEDYVIAIAESILSMAEVTNGRILVLFTAFDMLKKTYSYLSELLEEERYMLFAQGISSGSRHRLQKNFQSFENSILLGTNSFWEGVDIPGEDLQAIVIARLPFEPPGNPVYLAKEEQLTNSGKNPFMDYSLPKAILRFKQGFGRLIRREDDTGIIFICDDRILTKAYGKYFINSLPKIEIKYDSTKKLIESIEKWL